MLVDAAPPGQFMLLDPEFDGQRTAMPCCALYPGGVWMQLEPPQTGLLETEQSEHGIPPSVHEYPMQVADPELQIVVHSVEKHAYVM